MAQGLDWRLKLRSYFPVQPKIVFANKSDVQEILKFITELAVFEKLACEVSVTVEKLTATLFGEKKYAEVIFLEVGTAKAGFALFFHNYSTFLGQPGIYLEDLYVRPQYRGKGYGKKLLSHLASITVDRGCARLEWAVLNWNTPAIEFYRTKNAVSMSDWTMQRLTGDALKLLASGN